MVVAWTYVLECLCVALNTLSKVWSLSFWGKTTYFTLWIGLIKSLEQNSLEWFLLPEDHLSSGSVCLFKFLKWHIPWLTIVELYNWKILWRLSGSSNFWREGNWGLDEQRWELELIMVMEGSLHLCYLRANFRMPTLKRTTFFVLLYNLFFIFIVL